MRAWLDDPENKLHMLSFQASMESLRNFRKESVVRVGSVCTGWGVCDMVVGAITAILADRCDLKAIWAAGSGVFDVDVQFRLIIGVSKVSFQYISMMTAI